ncbi:MAG: hypothetical protein HFH37_10865 [Lachnospiraceae bacterium]|nr:hypothetical protein [Lachnospiraceae bacterium]
MDIDKNEGKPLTIYQTVISGVEEILRKIEEVSWNKKLLLKNDTFLESEKYQKVLLDKIVFFTPGEEIEDTAENLISLFQMKGQETAEHKKAKKSADAQQIEKAPESPEEKTEKASESPEEEIGKAEEEGIKKTAEDAEEEGIKKTSESVEEGIKKTAEDAEEGIKKTSESIEEGIKKTAEDTEEEGIKKAAEDTEEEREMQILFCRKSRMGSPVKIFLEIHKEPYRIPFELHLIPFPGHEIFPQKRSRIMIGKQENVTYQMFPPEEYLTLAFYEIIKDLELIKDMSWYKEVYEVLCKEPVDGRKVWENMNRLTREYPIPSFEKRLDTFISYKDYGYMKRRWKSQSKRTMELYPQWKEVIELLTTFLTPVFEGVLKDEVFLGDWMPELGRYLD